jgi:hypothetical protein
MDEFALAIRPCWVLMKRTWFALVDAVSLFPEREVATFGFVVVRAELPLSLKIGDEASVGVGGMSPMTGATLSRWGGV